MLDSNGSIATSLEAHHLWQPKSKTPQVKTSGAAAPAKSWAGAAAAATNANTAETPMYKLRITVLKDGEFQGDAPPKTYIFPSLHHLTHATNALDAAFVLSSSSSCIIKKAGVEAPLSEIDAGHGTDGKVEEVTIEFTSIEEEDEYGDLKEGEGWAHFLGRLRTLEEGWVVQGGESKI